ncbi:MAG: RnfABCDGE type electron transport complex subunit D [Oscillospiraceae bacterium]|nr:RnfABCDGE type electron transport complex subunit D [Oscillospiraceae bacterium]
MKEKLMFQNAPHVRQSESVVTMMADVILALIPIYAVAFFYYGARSLVLGLCGAFFCCVFSAAGSLVLREKIVADFTPVITGLIIPLLLPANIPYYIVISACAVAILVVKIPFGGTGNNLFNPAAVGFASVAICWPGLVFSYPATMQKLEVFGEVTAKIAQSPAYSLSLGAVPDYNVLDMLLGSAPGPMGATNILVVTACGIFLIVKKAANWLTPAFFLLPYAALCVLFPRIGGSAFDALCYEIFSGIIVFGAFFMLTEPVTSPKRDFAKIIAGITSAIAVFLFRYFGEFEMGLCSALIVMNVFSPVYDGLCEELLRVYRHKESFASAFKKKKEAKEPEKTEDKEAN